MRRRTVYTLRDGSNHETRAEALAHCEEMIGAEMRDILSQRVGMTLEEMTRAVVRGDFDRDLCEVAEWIKEREQVKNHNEED